ncbi:MAG: ParB/RepB/Spo0J family partition protein [Rikenellaceae bacterium]
MSNNTKSKRLGRGLNAIFDTENILINQQQSNQTPSASPKRADVGAICDIKLSLIDANSSQPRQNFNDDTLEELANSISSLGLIQPITLCENSNGRYTIISGERRYRASKLIGKSTITAYIRKVDDTTMLEMALVENIQRDELTPIEVAITLQRLIDECGSTQEQISEKVGKKRSTIANYLRLLKLPDLVQHSISEGLISMGHAKALMGLEDAKQQITLLNRIIKEALSVRQTEELVKREQGKVNDKEELKKESSSEEEFPESYVRLVEKLEFFFNQEISIKKGSKGDGKIVIGFKNDDEISDILSKFENLSKEL